MAAGASCGLYYCARAMPFAGIEPLAEFLGFGRPRHSQPSGVAEGIAGSKTKVDHGSLPVL